MKRVVIPTAFALVCAVASFAFCQSSKPENSTENKKNFESIRSTDYLHPKMFVRVHEVRKVEKDNVDVIPIYTPYTLDWPAYYPQDYNVDAEVDLRSNIEIVFDRNAIYRYGSDNPSWEAAIMIRGQIGIERGSTNIEIPGYSLIGQKSDYKIANVKIAAVLANLWGDLINSTWKLGDLDQIRIAYDVLTSESTKDGTYNLAKTLNTHPDVFFRTLQKFKAALTQDSAKTKSQDQFDKALEEQHAFLKNIWNRYRTSQIQIESHYVSPDSAKKYYDNESNLANRLKGTFRDLELSGLKDTIIPVSLTGAKIGDQLVIKIINFEPDSTKRRELILRLAVTKFGLANRITDSFFFINRLGVGGSALPQTQSITSTTVDTTMAKDTNFQPSPGVTFGWTYFARENSMMRFLKPGFGFNVSFPRFTETRTLRLQSDTSGTSRTTTLVSSDEGNEVDVAVGPVLSLFDNVIQFTYGWNLTVQQKRRYWGIGLSFVKAISTARDAK